jgi:hypothetical protein
LPLRTVNNLSEIIPLDPEGGWNFLFLALGWIDPKIKKPITYKGNRLNYYNTGLTI